ncbi:MAG: SRPBCC family protein [Actinomycetota bacterium]|nr:SRPBCC family protein [Actinomycetota bacterium]
MQRIWALLADPARYPEWAGDSMETTGVPTRIEKGSTFEQTSPGLFGRATTTTFAVEELDDLRQIKLRCQSSGYYSHWRLTEAQGQTFADVEIGIEPIGLLGRVARVATTKSQLREVTEASLDGLRRASTE